MQNLATDSHVSRSPHSSNARRPRKPGPRALAVVSRTSPALARLVSDTLAKRGPVCLATTREAVKVRKSTVTLIKREVCEWSEVREDRSADTFHAPARSKVRRFVKSGSYERTDAIYSQTVTREFQRVASWRGYAATAPTDRSAIEALARIVGAGDSERGATLILSGARV